MPSSFFYFKPLNGMRFPSTPGFNLNETNGVFLNEILTNIEEILLILI